MNASTKLKILIVDDAQLSRKELRSLLEKHGYEIEEATDGLEALEKIRAERPDMVVMDIMIPKMNGIDCCRLVKGDPLLADTKILMVSRVSPNDVNDHVVESFHYGCDDFIGRPINEQELLNKVTVLGIMASRRERSVG